MNTTAAQPHSTFITRNPSPQYKSHAASRGNNEFADLARYLAKRDLVTEGLTKFTDKPEDYWAWEASFTNTIEGLSLKPSEELDLLTQWLGGESSRHAKRIRSVHQPPSSGSGQGLGKARGVLWHTRSHRESPP